MSTNRYGREINESDMNWYVWSLYLNGEGPPPASPSAVDRHGFPQTPKVINPIENLRRPSIHATTPKTRIQALMEASPGDEPAVSVEDYNDLRELLADAIDSLDPFERILFDAYFIERMSFRSIEARFANAATGRPMKKFSKTTLHRMIHGIRQKLAVALGDNPIVRAHLLEVNNEDER